MKPLDGVRNVFLSAIRNGNFAPNEKKRLIDEWNAAIKDIEKRYEIKSQQT